MCSETRISINDYDNIRDILSNVINNINSLDELSNWLLSQECIESAFIEDFLIKTDPPQKQIVVNIKLEDGSIKKKAIDVVLLENQTFRLSEFYDLS